MEIEKLKEQVEKNTSDIEFLKDQIRKIIKFFIKK